MEEQIRGVHTISYTTDSSAGAKKKNVLRGMRRTGRVARRRSDVRRHTLDLNATNEVYDRRHWHVDLPELADETAFDNEIQSYLYKTAKNYYCSVKYFENPEVLLYANKSWTFPKQDVNLTLKFPGPNDDYFENFLITGFKVTLYQDGQHSRGFVNSGGMMQMSDFFKQALISSAGVDFGMTGSV
ncbi:hypothetical protein EVAR_79446_1 [Eumeta japonica]|uniref:Uncharacterized protein n=1 Tax=Eumeta variegata TaxID=151549 RepID=A0A4C2A4C4_EUMVA|nr:hypothetical protein EVAR_79446_1 [Eumeta japonica]